jgi:hypothetical protein
MAFGDIGGPVTELVLTCRTPDSGAVDIHKGDALKLSGPYTVSNDTEAEDPVLGQAMAPANTNSAAIPVKVRGVCLLPYTGDAPAVDGVSGVVASATPGVAKAPAEGAGRGLNLRVDPARGLVHVLL